MHKFKASSGAEVMVNPAPWQAANDLKSAIQREVNIDSFIGIVAATQQKDNSQLMIALLGMGGSPVIDAVIWPCLIHCTRDNVKIVPDTFDDVTARPDYYEILTACIKENLGPLFGSLFLQLKAIGVVKTTEQAPGTATPK